MTKPERSKRNTSVQDICWSIFRLLPVVLLHLRVGRGTAEEAFSIYIYTTKFYLPLQAFRKANVDKRRRAGDLRCKYLSSDAIINGWSSVEAKMTARFPGLYLPDRSRWIW